MPDTLNPGAVKAAEAVEQYLYECRNSESIVLVETSHIAALIQAHYGPVAEAQAVEAGYREGHQEAARCGITEGLEFTQDEIDDDWLRSKARASLGQEHTGLSELIELRDAARGIIGFLRLSTEGVETFDAVYRPPAVGLRMAADAMEKKDAAIKRFGAALAKTLPAKKPAALAKGDTEEQEGVQG